MKINDKKSNCVEQGPVDQTVVKTYKCIERAKKIIRAPSIMTTPAYVGKSSNSSLIIKTTPVFALQLQ